MIWWSRELWLVSLYATTRLQCEYRRRRIGSVRFRGRSIGSIMRSIAGVSSGKFMCNVCQNPCGGDTCQQNQLKKKYGMWFNVNEIPRVREKKRHLLAVKHAYLIKSMTLGLHSYDLQRLKENSILSSRKYIYVKGCNWTVNLMVLRHEAPRRSKVWNVCFVIGGANTQHLPRLISTFFPLQEKWHHQDTLFCWIRFGFRKFIFQILIWL